MPAILLLAAQNCCTIFQKRLRGSTSTQGHTAGMPDCDASALSDPPTQQKERKLCGGHRVTQIWSLHTPAPLSFPRGCVPDAPSPAVGVLQSVLANDHIRGGDRRNVQFMAKSERVVGNMGTCYLQLAVWWDGGQFTGMGAISWDGAV